MFYGFVITEAGNRLLARQVAGDHLDISRVVMDKGTCESDEAARVLTAPIEPGPNGVYTVRRGSSIYDKRRTARGEIPTPPPGTTREKACSE